MNRKESQEFVCNLGVGNAVMAVRMSLMESGFYSVQDDFDFNHPTPAFNRLFLFSKGPGARVNMEGRPFLLRPHVLYLLPIGRSFDVHYLAGSTLHYHHIQLAATSGLDVFADDQEPVELRGRPDLETEISEQGPLTTPDANLRRQTAVFATVCAMAIPRVAAMGEGWNRSGRFHALLRHIHAHCRADMTANDLADWMNMSRSALSKGFRRSVGLPLRDHIDKILLQKIKDRLVIGEDSAKQIAADLGFSDPAYLFRFFKRLTGMSPGDFRRSSRLPEQMR